MSNLKALQYVYFNETHAQAQRARLERIAAAAQRAVEILEEEALPDVQDSPAERAYCVLTQALAEV